MNKQEAIPHKLVVSRKGTCHMNQIFSIDFNISQCILRRRSIKMIPLQQEYELLMD